MCASCWELAHQRRILFDSFCRQGLDLPAPAAGPAKSGQSHTDCVRTRFHAAPEGTSGAAWVQMEVSGWKRSLVALRMSQLVRSAEARQSSGEQPGRGEAIKVAKMLQGLRERQQRLSEQGVRSSHIRVPAREQVKGLTPVQLRTIESARAQLDRAEEAHEQRAARNSSGLQPAPCVPRICMARHNRTDR